MHSLSSISILLSLHNHLQSHTHALIKVLRLMGSEICVKVPCVHDWKKGWPLRSGGFSQLCIKCGVMEEWKRGILDPLSAYEMSVFCNNFHRQKTGWMECKLCNKPIHCGCVVSRSLFEYLDFDGIGCVSCVASQLRMTRNTENPNGSISSTKNNASDQQSALIDGTLFVDSVDEGKLMQLCRIVEASEPSHWNNAQRDSIISCSGQNIQEVKCSFGEVDTGFSNVFKPPVQSLIFSKFENNISTWEIKNTHESTAQPSLNMYLGNPSGNNTVLPPSAGEIVDARVEGKASPPFHQGQRSRPILPKPLKIGLSMNPETDKGAISHARIARPPADGRGKSQLLPRYWPRITDQELERLSGDLKSTVVPLFEKILSASDAGRIGRLVLPKACAEAYFPPISNSDGLPLRVQDVKGNEWTFQFRFWPNNNSRMYVLEGVTPCIQAMQLCAGDTVTFNRIDPGGKLVVGFRKASNSIDTQDASTSSLCNGISTKVTTNSGGTENLLLDSSYADLLQSIKGNGESNLNGHPKHLDLGAGAVGFLTTENCEKTNNHSLHQPIPLSEKKRTHNIGPKSKRLRIDNEDAMELRLTWEETQHLLRPPPSVQPSIVTIEDQVIEEYEEPPVFGKRTIFCACSSGGKEQWAQCDDCSKWRRLPVDALLPPKWTCSENGWDGSRSSCSVPEEMSSRELENLLKPNKDFKRRRTLENGKSVKEHEPSGLDALAIAAVLGENLDDPAESSAGATTKHPRHRPGCSCIVCIQPPSGKGRHKPTCTCNVCMTVKRRFKTLMLRKKKRQSEREADAAKEDHNHHRDESEANGASKSKDDTSHLEKEGGRGQPEAGESSAGQIDLNSHPNHADTQMDDITGLSLSINHLEITNHQVREFMSPNDLKSFNSEVQADQHSLLLKSQNNLSSQLI
ncbi:putative transcription factor & chromatin remodeling CW-Zn-B3/VAL family [Lupinus albus]|uniref:Putative transcription factor & chromatin remodeling CW-Zn-B3/VAL family n=1 Tax=Lupinus albus TaxID=3870 RepID=A0A6A4NVH0_LUPAL|nr:putative transcription factor & chromatin remodeling CW-Zn-B3/VAL family [Lupinus albus]